MECSKVRCRKCRLTLLNVDDCFLLNAHGDEFRTLVANEETCLSVREKRLLYIQEETVPDFVLSAIEDSSWTKGKIYCPKCTARLGSFNFIAGAHCSCGKALIPPVHFLYLKVDYIHSSDQLPQKVSYPHCPASSTVISPVTEEEDTSSSSWAVVEKDPSSSVAVDVAAGSSVDSAGDSTLPPACNCPEDSEPKQCQVRTQSKDMLVVDSFLELCLLPGDVCTQTSASGEQYLRRRGMEPAGTAHSLSVSGTDAACTNKCLTKSDLEWSGSGMTKIEDIKSESSLSGSSVCSKDSDTYPDHLICPICLDLLYSPFSVKPCGHVFCEPCLRRLGKPCPVDVYCPLCRNCIQMCIPCSASSQEIRECYSVKYEARKKFEKENSGLISPLPYSRDSRCSRRFGNIYQTGWNNWRTVLYLVVVDLLALVLIVFMNWILSSSEFDSLSVDRSSEGGDVGAITSKHRVQHGAAAPPVNERNGFLKLLRDSALD